MTADAYKNEDRQADPAHVTTREEAEAVTEFLLKPGLFGTPLTPGETALFRELPLASVGHPHDTCWYFRNGDDRLCAVLGMRHHHNHTGIYEVYAFAVDPSSRYQGFGRRLLTCGLQYIASVQGRGMIVDTSAHPSYAPMHKLLDSLKFALVGRFPDFYYAGEDTLWYYHAVNSGGS